MTLHVDPEFVIEATQILSRLNLGLFTDFLVIKRELQKPEGRAKITNTSTLESIRRFMEVRSEDGEPLFSEYPFFNPLDSKGSDNWRVADYPRTGPQSNIKRGNLGSIFELDESTGTTFATLHADYVSIMSDSLLGRKKKSERIPLGDLAAWACRYDSFPQGADGTDVVGTFLAEYGITSKEKEAFFIEGRTPIITDGPVDYAKLSSLMIARYGDKEEKRKGGRIRGATDPIPNNLREAIAGEIMVDAAVLDQIITLVRLGRNIIMTGPPGTGKSTLAVNLSKAAASGKFDLPQTEGWLLTTATADWSTFDTIGGYAPSSDGSLEFRPGMFLRAIRANEWLIVDELNRADVDKAFGQLFSVLSGQSVDLPFLSSDERQIRIASEGEIMDSAIDTDTYVIHDDWRVVATMNTVDRSQLFQVSAALMRRFAVVHVPVPNIETLRDWLQGEDYPKPVTDAAIYIVEALMPHRALGPAIVRDIVDYLEAGHNEGDNLVDEAAILAALSSFVLPQLDGLSFDALREIRENLSSTDSLGSLLETRFAEIFGD